ncbi:hypothetical protein Kpol_1060p12 [Vanderwaltozyma polyspora DSM 70294]|uniref:Lactoylglutathione lyase n=1 Tax=Vanderwaltozyma polyspora (strain ATCC 22028 / DSM 70294 / BCRC 21397 / CBS 2163 / NBRC 10782 / NRRL Y-8283 / UCD 57-17) TaxID=436907 RepID=A7TK12_VANPO|nr:uncharacterized protein Kpol_1060p12 [Vanderwaltozyma polyspora DSM 70294]EDO17358.1 hypothetical protein Kpol_1060p12 [Vanderwaltozyma polyspora DSM 70294]
MTSSNKDFSIKIEAAHNDPSLTFNHTCLRVKDPVRSVEFYEKNFGMKLHAKKDFPDMKFSLYFLSFPKDNMKTNCHNEPDVFSSEGILELTHNWGSESDPEFKINNGNVEPHRGFGHICFAVADVEKECNDLEAKGVAFQKKLSDGRQKDIAFALDPDGYWIELIGYLNNKHGNTLPTKDVGMRFNHTMIRIKDPSKTLDFYQNVLGMKIHKISEHANAKFTNYFLGYDIPEGESWLSMEGILELCHNWGTENDPDFSYHNGNQAPQGYGHICVSCTDPSKLCSEIEEKYGDKITWAPKFNQGKMKNLAFLKDPDGYSIEVVPHGLCV